jgi:uncharacterized protein (DUF924 family)
MTALAEEIHAFWFGPDDAARDEWFRKDAAFDATIRSRFGAAVEAALAGAHGEWTGEARGSLALVILLDQFTRNIYRGTPRAFAGDPRARQVADAAVTAGQDAVLRPHERSFLYLPFEHAEDAAAQDRSIALYTALAEETGLRASLQWAEKHAAIIRRFGRYPHRNAILGRNSTPEEIVFLQESGSRF